MKVGILLFLMVPALALSADTGREIYAPTVSNIPRQFGRDFVDTAVDLGAYLASPVSWDKKDWATFLVVTGVTVGLFFVDRPIFFAFDPAKTKPVSDALEPIQLLGDFRTTAVPLSVLYVGSFFVHDKKLQSAARLGIRSLMFQALINQTMKNVIFRRKVDSPWDFQLGPPRWEIPSPGAFPAGHSSNVWAVMSAFALVYEDDPVIPWVCYGLALGNNVAQVLNRDHWISEIFFGAAMGYFTTTFLASRDEQRGFAVHLSPESLALGYRMEF